MKMRFSLSLILAIFFLQSLYASTNPTLDRLIDLDNSGQYERVIQETSALLATTNLSVGDTGAAWVLLGSENQSSASGSLLDCSASGIRSLSCCWWGRSENRDDWVPDEEAATYLIGIAKYRYIFDRHLQVKNPVFCYQLRNRFLIPTRELLNKIEGRFGWNDILFVAVGAVGGSNFKRPINVAFSEEGNIQNLQV